MGVCVGEPGPAVNLDEQIGKIDPWDHRFRHRPQLHERFRPAERAETVNQQTRRTGRWRNDAYTRIVAGVDQS